MASLNGLTAGGGFITVLLLTLLPTTVQAQNGAEEAERLSPNRPACTDLAEARTVDAEQTGTCVQRVFSQRERPLYEKTATAYLHLIEKALTRRPGALSQVEKRFLNQLAIILPTRLAVPVRRHAAEDSPRQARPRRGGDLLEWWRGQDPLPATKENERLFEHLERVAFATETYASGEDPVGFDERGVVYVRLGPPGRAVSVSFNDSRIISEVLRESRTLMRSDFPQNEYWTYPRLSSSANYLFIEGRDGYELSVSQELVPSTLRRGRRRSSQLRVVLEEVYRQLAIYNVDFGSWHQELVTTSGASLTNDAASTTELFGILDRQRSAEEQQVQRRLHEVPQQYSDVPASVGRLDVYTRVARFLTPDGATRTEVYWSVPLEQLWANQERGGHVPMYLLTGTTTQRSARSVQREAQQRRHLISFSENRPAGAMLAPQTYVTRSTADTFHVSVQWDEYVAQRDPQTQRFTRLGAHLRRQAHNHDSLTALRATGGLGMSDLKPLLLTEEISEGDATAIENAPPYPFKSVSPEAAVGLYFELYQLGLNEQDQTRYRVEYAVARSEEPQGLSRLFRRSEEQRATTESVYSGRNRTTREYIVLDLQSEEATQGQVQVAVRVTDETTGRQVERSIQFDLRGE